MIDEEKKAVLVKVCGFIHQMNNHMCSLELCVAGIMLGKTDKDKALSLMEEELKNARRSGMNFRLSLPSLFERINDV